MSNYAGATIEGFITHEPVFKQTKTGKSLCQFSLAVNHYAKEDDDPKVSYVDVETWNKTADVCSKYLSKGRRIMVIGNLRQDRWETKEGKFQSKIKIVGNEVIFLDNTKEKESKELAKAV
jgi:single-strand DNA-binding protein